MGPLKGGKMATPIEKNYGGRMEEIDTTYKTEELSQYGKQRRSLLKAAGAGTGLALTAPLWEDSLKDYLAAFFGGKKSKAAEALAEDGVSVYIGEIRSGNRPGEGEWPELKNIFYYEMGPRLQKRNFKLSNKQDAIIITGMITEQTFTVRASLQYIKNGEIIGGDSYEVPHQSNLDGVLNGLADRIANDLYKITGKGYTIKEKTETTTPDEIVMEIDGKMRRLKKMKPSDNIRRAIEEKDEIIINSLRRQGIIIIDKETYKIY